MTVTALDTQQAGLPSSSAYARLTMSLSKPDGLPVSSPYGVAVKAGALSAATLLPSWTAPALSAYHLMPEPRGALKNLVAKPVTADVTPGKVLIAVKAVGINFR